MYPAHNLSLSLYTPTHKGKHPANNQAALLSVHCSRQLTRCLPAAPPNYQPCLARRSRSCHSMLLLLLLQPSHTLLPRLLCLHLNLCCTRSGGQPQGNTKQTATRNTCRAPSYCHAVDLCGETGDLHTKRPYTAATRATPLHYCTL